MSTRDPAPAKPASSLPPAGAVELRRGRRWSDRLPHAAILVVEDEYWVAETLAQEIAFDGNTVIGPAATSAKALALLDATPNIGAAILDVRLGEETAFAIAERLREREIPFVFFTGFDDIPWPPHFRSAPKISKTADWRDLKRILFGPTERSKHQPQDFREALVEALPRLRALARKLAGNATAGDRMVERVLETAITQVEARRQHASVEAWLISMLHAQHTEADDRTLN
jgi:CheY-like chemotaxis protein